jgi:hypothetical protein
MLFDYYSTVPIAVRFAFLTGVEGISRVSTITIVELVEFSKRNTQAKGFATFHSRILALKPG